MTSMLSRKINFWLVSASPAAASFVECLTHELESHENRSRNRGPKNRSRLNATMESIIFDLIYAHDTNPERWLSISMAAGDYSAAKNAPYHNPSISYRNMDTCLGFLADQGYLEILKGFIDPFTLASRWTKIKSTRKLQSCWDRFGIQASDIHMSDDAPTIKLKSCRNNEAGTLLDYRSMPGITDIEANMKDLNEYFRGLNLTLDLDQQTIEEIKAKRLRRQLQDAQTRHKRKDVKSDIQLQNCWMYRVFNKGSLNLGGRFYGPWWQSIPKDLRKHIHINGEETVELDFSAMHPRMLYQLEGIDPGPEVDPYSQGDLGLYPREIIKKVFNQLLNAKDDTRLQTDKDLANEHCCNYSFHEVANAIREQHKPISRWFLSGAGLRLQNLDSQIAEKVMVKSMSLGFPALGVHDSFIGPSSCKSQLKRTMHEAYTQVMGYTGVIDAKGGL